MGVFEKNDSRVQINYNNQKIQIEEKELNHIVERLIEILLAEQDKKAEALATQEYDKKRELLRRLMVKRKPAPLSSEFMQLQNKLLQSETDLRPRVMLNNLSFSNGMALFCGDIRTLVVDAIVNAANPKMLGSFDEEDNSIDSVIMTSGGLQIRQELNSFMMRRREDQTPGCAVLTKAYNLPCKYIIHTVGPEILNKNFINLKHKMDLVSCYNSCLNLAKEKGFSSIAFPAIATGTYHFPKPLACKIAVTTVRDWLKNNDYDIKVIFCAFDEENKKLYLETFRDNGIR